MSPASIIHPSELTSNAERASAASYEPKSLRTYTTTQAVLARSAGVYHWTPEGRRLYDFTSGVLVSHLGPNPTGWMRRFAAYMKWPAGGFAGGAADGYTPAMAMTAYNAVTPVETDATRRLLELMRGCRGG